MTWASILGKITGTVDQHHQHRINYLQTEVRVLRQQMPDRLRFTDPQRCMLALAAKPLGRSGLAEMDTLVTPDTLLEWHRRLVERKIARQRRSQVGRPPTEAEIVELVLLLADENPRWGYDRIVGVLAELDYHIAPSTVANILRNHGRLTAPHRKRPPAGPTSSPPIRIRPSPATSSPRKRGLPPAW